MTAHEALTIEDIFKNQIHRIQNRGGEEEHAEEEPSDVEDGHDDQDCEALEEEEFHIRGNRGGYIIEILVLSS